MTNESNSCNSKYRNFYVLGDSLSDNGAFIEILKYLSFSQDVKVDEPFYEGRSFSNGPMAVEYVAQYLGKEFNPGWKFSIFGREHEQIGQNYAISNATAAQYSGYPYSLFLNEFQLEKQLNSLVSHHQDISQEDLFLIMIGGNDIMEALSYNVNDAEKVLEQAVNGICNALEILNIHGAKNIIVVNAPNIGLIPAFNKEEETKELLTKFTEIFNKKLADSLEDTKKKHPNLEIKQLDLYSKLESIINEYKNKGLNYQDAGVSDYVDELSSSSTSVLKKIEIVYNFIMKGKLCAEYQPPCSKETLDNYLFFDYFHPTAEVHKEVGNELYELIIEPYKEVGSELINI